MDNFSSVLFYIMIIIVASIFAMLSKVKLNKVKNTAGITKRNKSYSLVFIILSYLTLTLPMAFRYYTGADYISYITIYNDIELYGVSASSVEIGFAILNFLCIQIFNDNQSIFVVMAALTNYFFFKGILSEANKKNISIGIAIFVYGFTLYFWGYIIIRNMLGIALIFYALKFIFEKKLWKYYFLVTIAVLFHYSLAIFYIFGLFYVEKLKTMRILIASFSLISIPFIPVLMDFIGSLFINYVPRFAGYQTYLNNTSIDLNLYTIYTMLPLVPFIIFYKKMVIINNNISLYFSFYVISVVLMFYSTSVPLLTRYVYALWPAQIILFATFIKLFDRDFYGKILVSGVIIVYGLILILNFLNVDIYYMIPYKSILQRD